MRITIETVPHSDQRYDTVGDWQTNGEELRITVSRMPDWRYEALVAVHELIEALLCRRGEVSQDAVDGFDLAFKGDGEPGDDPAAPYYRQHQIASRGERLLAEYLGVDWTAYEAEIEGLSSAS